MRKFLLVILCSFFLFNLSFAQDIQRAIPQLEETDGSPTGTFWKWIFPNSSLTDNSDGTTSISFTAPLDSYFLNESDNLSDLDNTATARTNLGLVAGGAGDIWVEKTGDTMTGTLTITPSSTTDGLTNTILSQSTGGTELITNQVDRDFSGAGNWTGTNWAIVAGALKHTAGSTADAVLANANLTASSIIDNRFYQITFTISGRTGGTVTVKIGTAAAVAIGPNGTYSQTVMVLANDANLIFTPSNGFDGSLDNISLKAEVSSTGIFHNGFVGIGTTAPEASLHFVSDRNAEMVADTYNVSDLASQYIARRARGTQASPSAIKSGDVLGAFSFRGYGATAFSGSRAKVTAYAAEDWTDTAQGTYFKFQTVPKLSTTLTEVMRIMDSGYIGIGTTTPGAPLEVIGQTYLTSGSASGALRIGADVNATTLTNNTRKIGRITGVTYSDITKNYFILAGDDGGVSTINSIYLGGYTGAAIYAATDIHFFTAANATTTGGTERMGIDKNGNVGIGTTTPDNPLELLSSTTPQFRLTNTDATDYATFSVDTDGQLDITSVDGGGTGGHICLMPDGNVGIGTITPGAMLEVLKTTEQLRLSFDADSFCSFTVASDSDLTIKPAETGQIILQPTTDSTTFFQILDADGGASIFNIDATNERVGIGTASPAAMLDIDDAGVAKTGLRIDTLNGSVYSQLFARNGASSWGILLASTSIQFLGIEATKDMVFVPTGNFGIADTAPAEKLDVTGNINCTGAYKVDDVQIISNRIIDARIDDTPNSGDATTDGIIAAIQSILQTHGLAAAS